MGLDLDVEQQKAFHRVRDVSNGTFVINMHGRPAFIPVESRSVGLRFEQSLKLSTTSVLIDGLKTERWYSVSADPVTQRQRAMMAMMGEIGDSQSRALGGYMSAQTGGFQLNGAGGSSPLEAATLKPAADLSLNKFDSAGALARTDIGTNAFHGERARADLERELFDSLDLSFEVSSAKPLHNAYVVIVTRFRDPNAKSGASRNWIYAESLGLVEREPRRVRVTKAGFPPGFAIEECKVHIYDRGTEVATNLSTKRVDLSAEEAFEYVKIEHIAKHKRDTVRAVPAMGSLPADLHSQVSAGQLDRTLYVKVTSAGLPVDVFTDEACTQKLDDDYVTGIVRGLRFTPALETGKPVDSVAAFKLGQLSL